MIPVVKKLMQLLWMSMSKYMNGTMLECSNHNASTKIPTSVSSRDVFERVKYDSIMIFHRKADRFNKQLNPPLFHCYECHLSSLLIPLLAQYSFRYLLRQLSSLTCVLDSDVFSFISPNDRL
jgi:hypothetical protein